MNYPLAQGIIGFAGGHSLNEALLRSHHEYGRITPLDGPAFAGRLRDLLGSYAPETNAVQLNLLDSHDTPRVLSLFGGDREAMEVATLLQMTLPGAPCIYYGDEVGLEGGIDPDSRRAFPWDEGRWDRALFDSVRGSVAARRKHPELRSDEVEVVSTSGPAIAFRRGAEGELAVVVNAGDEAQALSLGDGAAVERLHAVGRGRGAAFAGSVADGGLEVEIPGRSGAILRVRR
jgi:glycosidase